MKKRIWAVLRKCDKVIAGPSAPVERPVREVVLHGPFRFVPQDRRSGAFQSKPVMPNIRENAL